MTVYHYLLKDAIEMHCHTNPSLFSRKQTDWQLIEDVKKAQMYGVVIKSHESPTFDRATLINEKEQSIRVFGGLACNHFTGGLNPFTVDTAINFGAKIIWMPTFSAKQHQVYFKDKKSQYFQNNKMISQSKYGIEVLDEYGHIKRNVHEVLSLIAKANIVLATGHLSVKEVLALVEAAIEHGVQKILIQHPDLGIAKIPFAVQQELVSKGAFLEKCYLSCSPDFNDLSIQEMAESIKLLGAESCVMVTDYGQAHNIPPVEALSRFVSDMLSNGISEAEIQTMVSHNPKKLLGVT